MKTFKQFKEQQFYEQYSPNSYHKVHIEKDGKKTSFLGQYIGSSTLKDKTVHRFNEVDKEGVSKGKEQWVQHEYIKKTEPHHMNLKYGHLGKRNRSVFIPVFSSVILIWYDGRKRDSVLYAPTYCLLQFSSIRNNLLKSYG